MRGLCPVSESQQQGCKYYPDCYSDTHHLAKRELAKTREQKRWCGELTLQLCRRQHEELEYALGWLEYPETRV